MNGWQYPHTSAYTSERESNSFTTRPYRMVYTHTHIGRKRQSIFMGTFKITFKIDDEKRGGVRLVHVTCNIVRVNSMPFFFCLCKIVIVVVVVVSPMSNRFTGGGVAWNGFAFATLSFFQLFGGVEFLGHDIFYLLYCQILSLYRIRCCVFCIF